ncbi:glycosyltransferase [bacterium]|nr:glycosyltransferase [bacterium]
MRVGLVILHADPARGGAERYTVDLAAALARRGIESSLISSTPGPEIPGVTPVVLPARGLSRSGRYLRWLRAVETHRAAANYDIVHAALPIRDCDVYHPHAGLAAEAVERGHLKRTGWSRLGSWMGNQLNGRRQAFAFVERKLLSGSRRPIVISLSSYVQTAIRQFYRLPEDRHACLFNAVDLQRFDPAATHSAGTTWRQSLGCSDQDVLALMIAQDFARKGLSEAIAAVAQVPDPRLKLVVVGKPDPTAWQQQAQSLGVTHRVIFSGPTTQPAACYRGADFFVLPTKHDPCSLVVLEALAMGLPVITTTRNGAAEAMIAGQHGEVLADPDDVPTLADAMNHLCQDTVRSAMAERCLALRTRLSYDHHVETLLGIYGRVQPQRRAA